MRSILRAREANGEPQFQVGDLVLIPSHHTFTGVEEISRLELRESKLVAMYDRSGISPANGNMCVHQEEWLLLEPRRNS